MSCTLICPGFHFTAVHSFTLICPGFGAAKPPKISLTCPGLDGCGGDLVGGLVGKGGVRAEGSIF